MNNQNSKRIRTPEGDWYVATSEKDWGKAIARSHAACRRRHKRMAAWEAKHHPGCYPPASYWDAYNAEKYRIAIEWPMPEGHVIFQRKSSEAA